MEELIPLNTSPVAAIHRFRDFSAAPRAAHSQRQEHTIISFRLFAERSFARKEIVKEQKQTPSPLLSIFQGMIGPAPRADLTSFSALK